MIHFKPSARGNLALETGSSLTYTLAMNIRLPPEQERWLEAQIARGEFASIEDAMRRMIADRMAFDADEFAWARPYVDEARTAAARGNVVSLDDAVDDMDAHLASIKP